MKFIPILFFTLPFLSDVAKYPETLTHVSLWTWLLHIFSVISYLYNLNHNILFSASIIGSRYIYYGYLFSLLINPNLEYDLVTSQRQGWEVTPYKTVIRSVYYHVLPYILSFLYIDSFKFDNRGIILYISILASYNIIGIILKSLNNYALSPYNIYILTNSNKYIVISELGFIICQMIILLRIIYSNVQ